VVKPPWKEGEDRNVPPVTKMTFPESDGMSVTGLKSTWPRIAAIMRYMAWAVWTMENYKMPMLQLL
jgi:hypothetical protein